MNRLTPNLVATLYAAGHPLARSNPGKVYAIYEGGGWITLRGEGLKPMHSLRKQHPNGWSLLHRVRVGQARREIIAWCQP